MATLLPLQSFTGTNGAALPSGSGTGFVNGQIGTVGGSTTIQGNAARLLTGDGSYSGPGRTSQRANITNPTNVVWVSKIRNNGDECYPQIYIRGQLSSLDTQSGYRVELNHVTGSWEIAVVSGYTQTPISGASSAFTFTANQDYWVLFGIVGTDLRFKVWQDGNAEPAYAVSGSPTSQTWTGTNSTISAAGYVGVSVGTGNLANRSFFFDEVTIYDTFPTSTAFTGSRALSGTATLTQSGTPAVSGSAGLSGSGTLSGVGVPGASGSASGSGSGTLGATGSPGVTFPVSLSGSGTLTATGAPATSGAVSRSATGTLALSGTAASVASGSAGLSGEATLALSGTASSGATGTLALSATATLAPVASAPSTRGTATLSGEGTLGATGLSGTQAGGAVGSSSSATLATTAVVGLSGATSLSGTGSLAAAGSPATAGPVALAGTAGLGLVGAPGFPRPLVPSAAGSLTFSSAVTGLAGTGALGGAGDLVLNQLGMTVAGPGNLGGTASLTLAGMASGSGSASAPMTASASLTLSGRAAVSGALALSGQASLSGAQGVSRGSVVTMGPNLAPLITQTTR